ncbi:hypothetical protein BLA29_013150, partial [Euroglyphus maynei]
AKKVVNLPLVVWLPERRVAKKEPKVLLLPVLSKVAKKVVLLAKLLVPKLVQPEQKERSKKVLAKVAKELANNSMASFFELFIVFCCSYYVFKTKLNSIYREIKH